MDKDKLLKKIQEKFEAAETECTFYKAGEISPGSVLVCDHEALGMYGENGIGQYFFLNLDIAADNTEYFVGMITLEDEITDANMEELGHAICLLNYFQPYGAFVLSPEDEILYKFTVPMAADMDQDAAEAYADIIIAHTLDAFRRHIHLLISVVNGELTPDDIVELYDTSEEE